MNSYPCLTGDGSTIVLPDPRVTPTLTIMQAAEILGLSKVSAYNAAHSGEIPVIRVGRRLIVPTAKLLAALGFDQPGAP